MTGAFGHEFFDRPVNDVARELIGCTLTFADAGGVIVETEAYDATDPACHAYNGPTPRNDRLFGPPGLAYVYFSYGIHHLLNFVCEAEGSAAAVLIRALEPSRGLEEMRARRGAVRDTDLCSGPGKLTQALGVGPAQNGADLSVPPFAVSPPDDAWREAGVASGLRIGITKGVELPWRYGVAGNPHLSVPLPGATSVGRTSG